MTGMNSHNPFTVLNNTPNAVLQSVISDLDIEVANEDAQLDVFKLEELARAAIVEANYQKYLEDQNAKTSPQNDDDLMDLTMEVISNQTRDYHDPLTMEVNGYGVDEPNSSLMLVSDTS
jgi:hypothetical protein